MKLKELLDLVEVGSGGIYIMLDDEYVGSCPDTSIAEYLEGLKKAKNDYGEYYIEEIYPMNSIVELPKAGGGLVIEISETKGLEK